MVSSQTNPRVESTPSASSARIWLLRAIFWVTILPNSASCSTLSLSCELSHYTEVISPQLCRNDSASMKSKKPSNFTCRIRLLVKYCSSLVWPTRPLNSETKNLFLPNTKEWKQALRVAQPIFYSSVTDYNLSTLTNLKIWIVFLHKISCSSWLAYLNEPNLAYSCNMRKSH